ncbi:MAG: glucose-6-phosphate isomerase family protein [Alloacidobacterium sp.]|jgi:glucose-6-phosphate isomerase
MEPDSGQASGQIQIDWPNGIVHGARVRKSVTRLGQLKGIFRNEPAWDSMNPDTVVYSVQWQEPAIPDTAGALSWGSTTIESGCVGGEYFMTRGHFHAKRDRGEYYTTAQGTGILVLMGEDRVARVEAMSPGSLHYIPGYIAHRTLNTCDVPLVFWACWPSDAGHDYETIARHGFSVRVMKHDGTPTIIPEETSVLR